MIVSTWPLQSNREFVSTYRTQEGAIEKRKSREVCVHKFQNDGHTRNVHTPHLKDRKTIEKFSNLANDF